MQFSQQLHRQHYSTETAQTQINRFPYIAKKITKHLSQVTMIQWKLEVQGSIFLVLGSG